MVQIWIRMLQIPFEWFEFPFECFESLSNGLNFHSDASNPFQIARICIQMNGIPFEVFEMDLNASNSFRMVQISIQKLQIPFEWFEFGF